VTGLIDPSACRKDCVATDLARLVGSLVGDDRARWSAATAFYASQRPLTDAEAALLPALDQSGVILSAMAWLRRRYVLGQPCETEPVLKRLAATVERAERMAAS
jgi:Ser/Thr protein kinase RdoA (MazF antagonist)